MGRVPTSRARKMAIDHVIRAMRQEYETELEAVNQADNGGSLYLPAPEESSYFRAPPDPENILPSNSSVPVYVYPATDRSIDSRSTGGPTTVGQSATWNMEITLACAVSSSAQHSIDGHTITSNERLWVRSDLYCGAIVETISKYGCDGDSIHFLELVADQPALFFDRQRSAVGIATARFEITQKTSAPRRRSLP